MEYTFLSFFLSTIITIFIYCFIPALVAWRLRNLKLWIIRTISIANYILGVAFFYCINDGSYATGAAFIWSYVGYRLMKRYSLLPSNPPIVIDTPSKTEHISPIPYSSDTKVCLNIDKEIEKGINRDGFISEPHNFTDCYNLICNAMEANPDELSPIQELTLVTFISVFQYRYEENLHSNGNYICETRMQFIDSIIFTMFTLRALCIISSSRNHRQFSFSKLYIALVKQCLCSYGVLGLPEETIDKIFNERTDHYDRSFINSQDGFFSIFKTYCNILTHDTTVEGYEPYNPNIEYISNIFETNQLVTQARSHFDTLPDIGERALNRIIEEYINCEE